MTTLSTIKDENNVDALETSKLENLALLNIVVDVACRFDIFNDEFVDKLFRLLNIIVDAAFKLFIDKIEQLDNEFKLLDTFFTPHLEQYITLLKSYRYKNCSLNFVSS